MSSGVSRTFDSLFVSEHIDSSGQNLGRNEAAYNKKYIVRISGPYPTYLQHPSQPRVPPNTAAAKRDPKGSISKQVAAPFPPIRLPELLPDLLPAHLYDMVPEHEMFMDQSYHQNQAAGPTGLKGT
jgi:hypothetical protein